MDFGERMYDPRIARWPTVDKLAMKYPDKSPYSFTAGNPILYKEIDGRDYDVAIDHANRTITIRATYLVPTSKDISAHIVMNNGMQIWNDQNGSFVYRVGQGKDAIDYDVVFELTPAPIKYKAESGYELEGPPVATSNWVQVIPDAEFDKYYAKKYGEDARGINIRSVMTIPLQSVLNQLIAAHEMGHGLGARHTGGVMDPETGSLNQFVSKRSITDILGGAGLGDRKSYLNDNKLELYGVAVNVTSTGTAPAGFKDGTVKANPKAKAKK